MKLEEGMIVRLKNKVGRHKKGNIIKVLHVIGLTAFCENPTSGEKVVMFRESNEVEEFNKGVFYV